MINFLKKVYERYMIPLHSGVEKKSGVSTEKHFSRRQRYTHIN